MHLAEPRDLEYFHHFRFLANLSPLYVSADELSGNSNDAMEGQICEFIRVNRVSLPMYEYFQSAATRDAIPSLKLSLCIPEINVRTLVLHIFYAVVAILP